MAISYKERAVFSKENEERIRNIITSERNIKKLSEIPPYFISMDLTWKCNYKCACCLEECINNEKEDLPLDIIDDIFGYCSKYKVRAIMAIGGEPFLHKKGIQRTFEKSIEYQVPLKTVTNGSCLGNHIDLIEEAFKVPGSRLRVSINSNIENYKKQTQSSMDLKEILKNINQITSRGVPVIVSTVVYPEEASKDRAIPNVKQVEEIIGYCKDTGVKELIVLPARDPIKKARYHKSENDKKELWRIRNKDFGIRLKMDYILCIDKTNLKKPKLFCCPSGFLTTLIGPNRKIYRCTDNRANEHMVIGKIEKPGDFEKFWHSEERVRKQIEKKCKNGGCGRDKVNSIIDNACDAFIKYGIDLTDYLIQTQKESEIFI